jgi:hypothetical protein
MHALTLIAFGVALDEALRLADVGLEARARQADLTARTLPAPKPKGVRG